MPESYIPQRKPPKRGRLLLFATLAVLLLCCMPFARRYYCVAAVQNALVRNHEISFGTGERPSSMPKILDDTLLKLLPDTENTWGQRIPKIVYRERLQAMFRGNIEEIQIFYPEGFRGDLGKALLRFKGLKKVTVFENDAGLPTEADYKLLCLRLRELPALEVLELGGDQITSDALAPLTGHPGLEELRISYSCHLTTEVVETIKSLPALKTLEVKKMYGPDEIEWESPSTLARFCEALPGVAVRLPTP